MNCKKCGNVLAPGSTICSVCGTPVNDMQSMNVNSVPEVQGAPVQPITEPEVPVNPVPVSAPPVEPIPAPISVEPTSPVSPTPVTAESQVNLEPVQPDLLMNNAMLNVEPMGQTPNMNPNMEGAPEPKKSNGAIYAIIGVLLVAIIGVGVYFLFFAGDSKPSGETTPSGNDTTNPSGEVTPTPSVNKTTIGDYDYVLPEGYTYKKHGDYDIISNSSDGSMIALFVLNQSYSFISLAKDILKTQYESEGYQVKSLEEKTYDGRNWLVVSYADNSEDGGVLEAIDAYTTLDISNSIEFGVVINETIALDDMFITLGKMVDTAEYSGVSGFNVETSEEELKVNVINWNFLK